MSKDISRFTELLREHGMSVTAPRRAIFETLLQADRPLKNGEIVKRTPHVDRTSVYRTLELFARLGVTETIIRGWTPLTELAQPFRPHHHHMVCDMCGRVIEIENDALEHALGEIATKYDFTPTRHVVELAGLCARCYKA